MAMSIDSSPRLHPRPTILRSSLDHAPHPLEMAEGDLTGTVGATIQMAWKHRRDHHVIVSRRNHDPILLCHLEAHELTHLRMETAARKVGRNRFFSTNPAQREVAMRGVTEDDDVDFAVLVEGGAVGLDSVQA